MAGPRRGTLMLGALLGVLAAFGARAQDLPRTSEKWAAAGGSDLTVLGQASPRRVEEIARDLALVRAGLLAIAGAPDHKPPYPSTVVLFRDDLTLRSYARPADGSAALGALLTTLDRQGRVLALSLETAQTQIPLAREALAGDLVDQLLIDPPAWLRTGLAGLMARMEAAGRGDDPPRLVERPGSGTAAGAPAGAVADTGSRGAPPPAAASGWPPPAALRSARRGEHAEAAIGLVRHLAHPRSERASQLRRYLTLLRAGAPSDPAFEECFFGSFEAIYSDVARVAARGGAPPIELEPPAPPFAARELPYDRVLLALGDLLVRTVPWNTVAAELHFRAVLERRPADAAALRGIALARELDDRHQDAAELWAMSLAAAPGDRTTLMLAGWSRLDHFRRAVQARRGWEDPLPDEVTAARDLFNRAMAAPSVETRALPEDAAHASVSERGGHHDDLGPPIAADASPHALHGFGATYLFARDGFEPALAALERAARLLPADDEIAADFILLHAHAGNQDLAWEMRRQRMLDRVAPELDAMVEKLLAEEALHAANQLLLVQQKPDQAMALVRGAASEVRNPATRGEIEGVLAQMEQVAGKLVSDALYERFLAAVSEAQGLVRERRFDQARRLIEPYAAEDVDPAVRDPARDILRKIDQVDR